MMRQVCCAYQDQDLVFARPDGSPIHPERLMREFDRHARVAGLPRIRHHDLRHTAASLMLAAGVPAKVARSVYAQLHKAGRG